MSSDDLLWEFYLGGCRIEGDTPISREAFDQELAEMRRVGIDRETFDQQWALAQERIGNLP